MNFKAQKFAVIAVATSLALVGCSKKEEAVAPQDQPVVAGNIWPLTQLPGPEGASAQPIVLMKIENDPSVRPQSGLAAADMVVEELVEGGMTRFATFFQSNIPDEAGPVRSARHVDASIASPVADYFVASGASGVTLAYLDQNMPINIVRVFEGGLGMHRTNYHPAPHNLFQYPMDIVGSNAAAASDTPGWFVQPATAVTAATATGDPVKKIALEFSKGNKPNWTWDATKSVWLRDDGSKAHMDKSGVQLSAVNVVVLRVTTVDAGYKDPAGGYVPRTVLEGTGEGFVIAGNMKIAVTWSKPDVKSPVTLTDKTGNVVGMLPGVTWVELIPTEGNATFEAGASAAASTAPSSSSSASPSASPSKSK